MACVPAGAHTVACVSGNSMSLSIFKEQFCAEVLHINLYIFNTNNVSNKLEYKFLSNNLHFGLGHNLYAKEKQT